MAGRKPATSANNARPSRKITEFFQRSAPSSSNPSTPQRNVSSSKKSSASPASVDTAEVDVAETASRSVAGKSKGSPVAEQALSSSPSRNTRSHKKQATPTPSPEKPANDSRMVPTTPQSQSRLHSKKSRFLSPQTSPAPRAAKLVKNFPEVVIVAVASVKKSPPRSAAKLSTIQEATSVIVETSEDEMEDDVRMQLSASSRKPKGVPSRIIESDDLEMEEEPLQENDPAELVAPPRPEITLIVNPRQSTVTKVSPKPNAISLDDSDDSLLDDLELRSRVRARVILDDSDEDDELEQPVTFQTSPSQKLVPVVEVVVPVRGSSLSPPKSDVRLPKRDLIGDLIKQRMAGAPSTESPSVTQTPSTTQKTRGQKSAVKNSLMDLLRQHEKNKKAGLTLERLDELLNTAKTRSPMKAKETPESAEWSDADDLYVKETELTPAKKEPAEDNPVAMIDTRVRVHFYRFSEPFSEASFALPSEVQAMLHGELSTKVNLSALFLLEKLERGWVPQEETHTWLFHLVAHSSKSETRSIASQCLCVLTERKQWILGADLFMGVLEEQYGLQALPFSLEVDDLTTNTPLKNEPSPRLFEAIPGLFDLLTLCMHHNPDAYLPTSLVSVFCAAAKTIVDHRFRWKQKDTTKWEHWKANICRELQSTLPDRAHRLHFLQQLPCTSPELKDIQRFLAFHFTHAALGSTPTVHTHLKVGHVEDVLMTDPAFNITTETDYILLFHAFSFLDLCLQGTEFLSHNMDSLQQVIVKLKSINSRIADPRAAFLERTKVKDLLLRMSMRLSFSVARSTGKASKQSSLIAFAQGIKI